MFALVDAILPSDDACATDLLVIFLVASLKSWHLGSFFADESAYIRSMIFSSYDIGWGIGFQNTTSTFLGGR